MLKVSMKQLLGLALFIVLVFTLITPVSASSTITGNNSFETAHSAGYWKFSNMGTTILPENEDAAYFKFTANTGEKVYVRSSYQNQYQGMKVEIFNNSLQRISEGDTVINPNSLTPFIYGKADATANSQTFYIKVSRGSYTGDMYFTVSILDRIKTGSGTFNFSGTATNPGNTNLNPNGVDSSVISMDLRNNTSIPKLAKVRSITTSSTQTPSQGNVLHKVMSEQKINDWYTSTVTSATSGRYTISIQDNLDVAQKWNFKYNAKATARSTMTNVRATINYEYDVTDQF
ncbi:hypothetical protein [Alkalihalobacillus sp. LMS39]|uniref:hypothetical protein n=1 Tax=Alkalihalobacillus sp. LMS39 TaxID=2924032 RepID=UPI001FB1E96D|nr:hypothetical protein [Alkalihalobacillus sp. LMS39]UOE94747.1 hypothetical protein MM271_03620 [Alkalihalobacillus sp. LMS39]